MGQSLCVDNRLKLPNLQEDLLITNTTLLEYIDQIREQYSSAIQQSRIYQTKQRAIFRGRVDKNNKRYGYGEFYSQMHAYFGQFENDLPQGFGLAIKHQHDFYRGQFKQGLFHGMGKQYGLNYEYEGEFEYGYRTKGIFRNDHFQYQGQFKNSTFCGLGRILFRNGTNYEGSFQNGKFQGEGILAFSNGKVYKGQFKKGKYFGKGNIIWTDKKKKPMKYVENKTKDLQKHTKLKQTEQNTLINTTQYGQSGAERQLGAKQINSKQNTVIF